MATLVVARKGRNSPLGQGLLALAHIKIDHDLGREPLERLAQFVELEALGGRWETRVRRETSRRR